MDTRSLRSEEEEEEEDDEYEEDGENEPTVPHPPLRLALDILELTQLCKLIKCIRDNDHRMIARLVEEGVPRLLDYTHPSEGETALGLAASYNDEHMVEYLLSLGADVNVVDLQGRTAAMRACEFGHVESVRILAEAGTDMVIVDELGNGENIFVDGWVGGVYYDVT